MRFSCYLVDCTQINPYPRYCERPPGSGLPPVVRALTSSACLPALVICGLPHGPQFVIGQDTLPGAFLGRGPGHAPNDRAAEVIRPSRMPRHETPQLGEGMVGHDGPAFVLDLVEQLHNLASSDAVNLPSSEFGEDQAVKGGSTISHRA